MNSGYSDIVSALKRYQFELKELPPEETVSGQPGFISVRDGVTVNYDGMLYIDNEPVRTNLGEFDMNSTDDVQWFIENFDTIINNIHANKIEQS